MRTTCAVLVLLGLAANGRAGEPTTPPRPVIEAELPPGLFPPTPLPPLGYYRVSAYEVWQNLAVDRQGFFRARVIDTPYGAFYRYNGQPYPWTTSHQYLYTPVYTGTPYRYMPYADD
jgi:hypothetical protein